MGFLKTHKLLHGVFKNPLMCYIKSHGFRESVFQVLLSDGYSIIQQLVHFNISKRLSHMTLDNSFNCKLAVLLYWIAWT